MRLLFLFEGAIDGYGIDGHGPISLNGLDNSDVVQVPLSPLQLQDQVMLIDQWLILTVRE